MLNGNSIPQVQGDGQIEEMDTDLRRLIAATKRQIRRVLNKRDSLPQALDQLDTDLCDAVSPAAKVIVCRCYLRIFKD